MEFVRTMEHANDEKAKYVGGGSSIAEKRAAKCRLKAERINAARMRKTTSSTLPSPSAQLTILPGSSATAPLDCPIMLPNSQALPSSPTTGTFCMPPPIADTSMQKSATNNNEDVHNTASGLLLKIEDDPQYLSGYSTFENQITDYESLVLGQQPMDYEFPMEFPEELNAKTYILDPSSNDVKSSNTSVLSENYADLQMPSDHNSLSKETTHGDDVNEAHQVLEGEYKGYPCKGMTRNSDDGYNWRKYGQKQVKGSEYPRSYYKCTHPNCLVKKKVERSFDGQITEIIYKGAPHNHAQPQPNRRAAASLGSSFQFDEMSKMIDGNRTSLKADHDSVWAAIQGAEDIKSGHNGLERTSSTSVFTDLSDPLSVTQGKSLSIFESAETPEFSSGLASADDDDQAAQQRMNEADNEDSESKRRKKESCMIESSMASRAVREPRVVVQIESEIDILDDGYRWRKYGQKVVKGNPNPRSYYKCTSAKCPVRKHVERASHDLKFVITTYEGKHNHEVPAARNSNHINSNGRTCAANTHQPLGLSSRGSNIPKPETQEQELAPHFERKPEFYDEYLRPFYLGNFNNDLKFGASSIYPMKIPPFHNAMPYGPYGLNSFHHNQAGSVVPDFSMPPLPLNLPPTGNLGLAGRYDFNNGKSVSSQPYYLAQQQPNDLNSFVKPKQEPKEESLYDPRLPLIIDQQGIYNRIMGGFSS